MTGVVKRKEHSMANSPENFEGVRTYSHRVEAEVANLPDKINVVLTSENSSPESLMKGRCEGPWRTPSVPQVHGRTMRTRSLSAHFRN
jgi:hypothetical protein